MTHTVKSGDLLIISSDGLFDNLYEDEIALILNQYFDSLSANNGETGESKKYTQEVLSSASELLVRRASNAGIKRDDMLIMLIHIE